MMTKKHSSQNFSSGDMRAALKDSLGYYLECGKIDKETHDKILQGITEEKEQFLFEKFFSESNQFIVEFINTTMKDWASDVIQKEISTNQTIQMTEVEQLKHRIAMISDDLNNIKRFILKNGLEDEFKKETESADECWCHIINIEIACNLEDDESLEWKPFNTQTTP